MDIRDLAATLPDPRVDKMPPPVTISPEAAARAAADKKFMDSLLDTRSLTQDRVKYALKSLFGVRLKKDGDYQNVFGGRRVWIKSVADYEGGTPVAGRKNWHTYVEVKGMSPGRNFDFARLDRTKAKPVQYDRLQAAHVAGDFVLLALGWWFPLPGARPVMVPQKTRKITRWKKEDVYLEIDLVHWPQFTELYNSIGRRSMRPKDREKLPPCKIHKVGNRWKTVGDHWWWGDMQ
jgi:hypothetical protein